MVKTFHKLFHYEHGHFKLLLSWPVFFAIFILTERLIPPEKCTPIHCALDDVIPFCEFFIIPYVLWYVLIAFSLGYFLFNNICSFKKLQLYIIITQIIAIAVYILFPSRQDLRPESFPGENIFTCIIGLLYRIDSNTGVCPSLHCAHSIAISSVWCKEKDTAVLYKVFIVLFCITICMSTVFIKQHSVLDFIAAIPLCLAAEIIIYHRMRP